MPDKKTESPSVWPTDGIVTLAKFHKDLAKIKNLFSGFTGPVFTNKSLWLKEIKMKATFSI